MTPRWRLFGIVGLFGCAAADTPPGPPDPCDDFYQALTEVPHLSVQKTVGSFESNWDGETYEGCELQFETNDSLTGRVSVPDFVATAGTGLYDAGWRMVYRISADGPGSGIHGLSRESDLCVVRWEQPAYLDDDGDLVQSDTLRMWIQCREAESNQ